MKHPARLTPAILVLALLAAMPALPQAHRSAAPRSTSFAEAVWSFLPDFVTRLWADLGCVVDPYGRCKQATAPPLISTSGDLGCGVDPFGRCASAASPTNGGH